MSNTSTCFHDPVDEILETVWLLEEKNEEATIERIMAGNSRDLINEDLLGRVTAAGLLRRRGDVYEFTDSGRSRGGDIIRRHRLAERLLVDVLNMQTISVDASACCFEHFLSPEVTDRICTLLGHPSECPHGLAIPRGPCCTRAEKQVDTAVVPLGELRSGESGRITYISTSDHHRLDRLTSLGLFPGHVVKVHQREPLFVVLLGETQLALDKEIVAEIYVLRS